MNQSVEFWSSVELGMFARGLMRELGAEGWQARHRFEVSEQTYREARTILARSRLRWRSYVSYIATLHRRIQREVTPSVMVVCTNTFYAPAAALRAAKTRGIPVVHWVFDLFPEILVESGKLPRDSIATRSLGRITRSTFNGVAANVFLGDCLLRHAENQYGQIPRAVVIPVGADSAPFHLTAPQVRSPFAPVRVLYCGNLGRMHDTETLLSLVRQGSGAGWSVDFRGHGSGFRALAASIRSLGLESKIALGGSLQEREWTKAMLAADIALVTMKCGAEGLLMPSKTYSAMMAGQAILAVCPKASDLALTVHSYDAGWVVEPGDVSGLNAALAEAVAQPNLLLNKRTNAFRAAQAHYTQRAVAVRWSRLLRDLVGTSGDQPS